MNDRKTFADRSDAGRQLAEMLDTYANRDDVVVLGLPRGGVPVAYEVAVRLQAPLDVFVVQKLSVPFQDEMAMGAIATGGVRVLNRNVIYNFNIDQETIDSVTNKERRELLRCESLYRDDVPMPILQGKIAILVDDGLATGATMRAGVQALKRHDPAKIVIAVPAASRDTCNACRRMKEVDEVICVLTPDNFRAVGLWYRQFDQTSDDEVRRLLQQHRARNQIQTS